LILAWIGAALVGLSLGLLGSGGAILTVPILVYLLGHSEKSAIAESLAIVGSIALVGAIRCGFQGRLEYRSAILLALPGIFGSYLGASISPMIAGAVQLLILAIMMLVAAYFMFRPGVSQTENKPIDLSSKSSLLIVTVQGLLLGLLTGLVGVGGGFLIVPVLVLLRRLPMPAAIGTSLSIIFINSLAGFLKYLSLTHSEIDAINWHVVLIFISVGIVGSFVGNMLSTRIYQDTLKRLFAVFLVVMACYIVVRQWSRLMPASSGSETVQNASP